VEISSHFSFNLNFVRQMKHTRVHIRPQPHFKSFTWRSVVRVIKNWRKVLECPFSNVFIFMFIDIDSICTRESSLRINWFYHKIFIRNVGIEKTVCGFSCYLVRKLVKWRFNCYWKSWWWRTSLRATCYCYRSRLSCSIRKLIAKKRM
jgi:hypothetical protein